MTQKQLMVGLQNTGKTTFIAALYHVVESGDVTDSLILDKLGENREYLTERRDEWLECKPFERTKLGEEQILSLSLKNPKTGVITELVLPDVSGETFRDQWEHRRSTEVFDNLAKEARGMLLFLHPETIKASVRINDVLQAALELEDGLDETENQSSTSDNTAPSPENTTPSSENITPSTASPTANPTPLVTNTATTGDSATPSTENTFQKTEDEAKKPVPWSPKFASTQVTLIEVLQFLMLEPHKYPLDRIAIVVSAWDLVKHSYSSPGDWLSKRVPMLKQFLEANQDKIQCKNFGISAQGGRLQLDDDTLMRMTQSHRISVVTDVHGEYGEHDITAPIKWLMNITT